MAYKITWLGHGSFQMEIGDHTILLDPFLDDNPVATVSAADMNPDFILLSHGHVDHVADVVPIAKRTGCQVITNVEIQGWLTNQGLENVTGHQPGATAQYDFAELEFTQAIHGSGLPDGSYGGLAMGIIVKAEGKQVYFACDTALFMDMRLYADYGLEAAFLPIGDYFTMGPDAALKAVNFVKPKLALPAHYNTFPPIEQDGAAWAARVSAETKAEGRELAVNETLEV